MENASNALIIAGGVLIAMLILSAGIILYNNYGTAADAYNKTWTEEELHEFNTQFTIFEGRTNIKPQEIASILKFVEENRAKGKYVQIEIKNDAWIKDNNSVISDTKIISFLQNNLSTTFICEYGSLSYNEEERVTKIIFIKI